jgi:hypothetical protein
MLVWMRMASPPRLIALAVSRNHLRTMCWKTSDIKVILSTLHIPYLPRLPPITNTPISVSMELPALSLRAAYPTDDKQIADAFPDIIKPPRC